jgi:predicted nucleic acid-binding protein
MRPLGEFAFILLKRTFSCEFSIIISDWLMHELKKNNLNEKKLSSLLGRLSLLGKLENVDTTVEDVSKAKKLSETSGTHWQDCLHTLLAIKGKAKYLVTRNVGDFERLGLIEVLLPEGL